MFQINGVDSWVLHSEFLEPLIFTDLCAQVKYPGGNMLLGKSNM